VARFPVKKTVELRRRKRGDRRVRGGRGGRVWRV